MTRPSYCRNSPTICQDSNGSLTVLLNGIGNPTEDPEPDIVRLGELLAAQGETVLIIPIFTPSQADGIVEGVAAVEREMTWTDTSISEYVYDKIADALAANASLAEEPLIIMGHSGGGQIAANVLAKSRARGGFQVDKVMVMGAPIVVNKQLQKDVIGVYGSNDWGLHGILTQMPIGLVPFWGHHSYFDEDKIGQVAAWILELAQKAKKERGM